MSTTILINIIINTEMAWNGLKKKRSLGNTKAGEIGGGGEGGIKRLSFSF